MTKIIKTNLASLNSQSNLAQTAEVALQEITNILLQIRELAVQSAKDTCTQSDRSSMQAEVTQLKDELQRIAETIQFNGQTLWEGIFTDDTFQGGAMPESIRSSYKNYYWHNFKKPE